MHCLMSSPFSEFLDPSLYVASTNGEGDAFCVAFWMTPFNIGPNEYVALFVLLFTRCWRLFVENIRQPRRARVCVCLPAHANVYTSSLLSHSSAELFWSEIGVELPTSSVTLLTGARNYLHPPTRGCSMGGTMIFDVGGQRGARPRAWGATEFRHCRTLNRVKPSYANRE